MTPKPFDTLKYAGRCSCSAWLPQGSTAERTPTGWRHCVACRPRPTTTQHKDLRP